MVGGEGGRRGESRPRLSGQPSLRPERVVPGGRRIDRGPRVWNPLVLLNLATNKPGRGEGRGERRTGNEV